MDDQLNFKIFIVRIFLHLLLFLHFMASIFQLQLIIFIIVIIYFVDSYLLLENHWKIKNFDSSIILKNGKYITLINYLYYNITEYALSLPILYHMLLQYNLLAN